MNRQTYTALAAIALLAVAVAAWFVLRPQSAPGAATPTGASSDYPVDAVGAPAPSAPAVDPAASAVLASEPAAAPASAAAAEPPLPALDDADASVQAALTTLLGKPAVLGLLQTDGFLRRVVATVDNLGRGHAPSRLWPVNPTAGKFTVDAEGRIAADNGARYAPLLKVLLATDPAAVAALYRRHYPLLQQAYTELGYPKQRFHLRLIEVIDQLLGTPVPTAPPTLTLTEVKGPIASERPWVRYEYTDARLEALPAGQKIMLRLDAAQRAELTAWLRRLRGEITRALR